MINIVVYICLKLPFKYVALFSRDLNDLSV